MIANIGYVEKHGRSNLALNGKLPILYIACAGIPWNIQRHIIWQSRRITGLRGSETPGKIRASTYRCRYRTCLCNRGTSDLRIVGSKQVRTAETIEVNVSDTIAATEHGFVGDAVCKSKPRCKVVVIRIDERAVIKRTIFGLNDRVCCRIVVRKPVVLFIKRCRKLVSEAGIDR